MGVAETAADGDGDAPASCYHDVEHEFGQVIDGLVLDVVFDEEEVILGRVNAAKGVGEYVL